MKTALLYVILSAATPAIPQKIHVQKHLLKDIYRIVNPFGQAVFCITENKGKRTPFYVLKHSFRVIEKPDPKTFRFICFEPEKKV